MHDAIAGIRATLLDVTLEAFLESWTLQRAVERGLEIISEASRSLTDEMKASAPGVPWSSLAGVGNILRHDYQRVEPRLVWNIVQEHLDDLETALRVISGRSR